MEHTIEPPLLQMKSITKSFPGVLALDNVDFDLDAGEVHALVGENGAGKSTLMKILSGVYHPDEGEVLLNGNPARFDTSLASQKAGISIIYQELNLIPHLNVPQNIFIGREIMKPGGFIVDEKKMQQEAETILNTLNITLDMNIPVNTYSVSKQQMIEVARALSFKSKILIMDEPTSALSESEIDELFKVIYALKAQGVGVIYISHRLEELKHIVDRITVLRDGKHISTDKYTDTTLDEVVKRMVGRTIEHSYRDTKAVKHQEKIMEIRNLSRGKILKNISFELYKGEILGLAGLMGAGRTELARAIFGADNKTAGEILLHGKKIEINSPKDAINAGIAYLSENRKDEGLLIEMLLTENIIITDVNKILNQFGILSEQKMKDITMQFIKRLDIRTPSVKQVVKNLSGGNQQKVVLAKWLFRNTSILLFDEPTRGIDIGAKFAIYQLMNELAGRGVGILMISSELPEIMGMCDRILVMHEGGLSGTLTAAEATQEKILNLAAGLT